MALFNGNQKKDKIQQLSDYINQSNNIVAITGAGISVGGGGVTYGQLSKKVHPGFGSLGNRGSSFLKSYVDSMLHYKPSFSHYALTELEQSGKLSGVITTNEDCMHTIAGTKNVAEIQGSFQVNRCSKCDRHYDGYEIWNKDELPVCESCGGVILPWQLYSNIGLLETDVEKARNWISKADMILVIGTNGYYGSAYWHYRNKDAVIVQINPGHTTFDRIASLNIREPSDDVFIKLKNSSLGTAGQNNKWDFTVKRNIKILDNTLNILREGSYLKDEKKIPLKVSTEQMTEAEVFLPDDVDALRDSMKVSDTPINGREKPPPFRHCFLDCRNIDTLDLARERLEKVKREKSLTKGVLVLNMASGIHPGGRVREGAVAQEEELCRRTSLLRSLESRQAEKYYKYNNARNTHMGSDAIVISPNVEVIRDEASQLLSNTFKISVISASAPMVRLGMEGMTRQEYEDMLYKRIQGILSVAAEKKYRNLILGAFGCGMYGNDAATVSDLFFHALCQFSYNGDSSDDVFDSIEFAVLCSPGKDYNYREFYRNFSCKNHLSEK